VRRGAVTVIPPVIQTGNRLGYTDKPTRTAVVPGLRAVATTTGILPSGCAASAIAAVIVTSSGRSPARKPSVASNTVDANKTVNTTKANIPITYTTAPGAVRAPNWGAADLLSFDDDHGTIGPIMVVPIRPPAATSRITGPELADLLGHWSTIGGPLYRLLAHRITQLADTGELPSGMLLPPERELALALSVSRNTAAAAYQLLRDEGLAQTRQGAGTRITGHHTTPAAVHRANGFFARTLESATVAVDLGLSAVDCAPQVAAALDDPASVLDARQRRDVVGSTGYHPFGLPSLRAAIADHLTTNQHLPTTSEQVLVTTGGQQAIDLALRCQVLAGQAVAVEDPTYPGAVDVLHRVGARPVSLPAGEDLDAQCLNRAVSTHRPALVYLIPSHHNPSGWAVPEPQRLKLAEVVDAHPDTLFVDDMTVAELAFDADKPPLPLAALGPGRRNLVTIGSLSKTYWGGLRIGWIRASTDLIRRIAAAKATADLGSTAHQQAIVAALMAHHHQEIVRYRVDQLRAGRDVLDEALRLHLPEWSWTLPHGGPTLWVRLPGHANAGSFAQIALRHGITVVPGHLLSATNVTHSAVRIAYTQPPEQLRAAAPALARAWKALGSTE
jgi:DNA-binding transcriptional MocR family regulator